MGYDDLLTVNDIIFDSALNHCSCLTIKGEAGYTVKILHLKFKFNLLLLAFVFSCMLLKVHEKIVWRAGLRSCWILGWSFHLFFNFTPETDEMSLTCVPHN